MMMVMVRMTNLMALQILTLLLNQMGNYVSNLTGIQGVPQGLMIFIQFTGMSPMIVLWKESSRFE